MVKKLGSTKQLQSSGYSVDGCGNGLDAEDYLKMATYDAVVLDIMLPGIDGLTLLKKMRAEGNTTHVLLLTALDSIENKVNGLMPVPTITLLSLLPMTSFWRACVCFCAAAAGRQQTCWNTAGWLWI